MPAELDSGFFVRKPAWHGEGYVPDRYPENWEEAREWAGLTWEPVSAPSFGYSGIKPDGGITYDPAEAETGDFFAEPGRQRIVRSDNGETLGVRFDQYQIITHAEMGEVVDAILQQDGVKYETAGAVQGGRAVWALAYLDEPVTLPGDNSQTFPYLALTTRHDGMGALRALSTSVRIVCSNTISAAEAQGEKSNTVFTFHHNASWKDRIEEARQTVTGLRTTFTQYVELATELANVKITKRQADRFIREFIPSPPDGLVSDRVIANVEKARQTVWEILDGPTTEPVRRTAYGLVQAATEYADHYRAYRSMDSHYSRQLLKPEPLKTKAVALAREVAKV